MKQSVRQILMCVLMLQLLTSTVGAAKFSDVSKSASYAEVVDYVSSTGLMVGYGDGKFQPEKTVTRAAEVYIGISASGVFTRKMDSDAVAVRPAMWIDLDP